MHSFFTAMVAPFLQEMEETKQKNKQKIEDILQKYRESVNYPRKKKKLVRKHLQLEYSIFKWAEKELYNFGF
jgi:hypothetical protein